MDIPGVVNAPSGPIRRVLFITDRNGVEHEIKTHADLVRILAQMTPAELAAWQQRYRFTPITNNTGIADYTGTINDLL